jgi:hypothetical protein
MDDRQSIKEKEEVCNDRHLFVLLGICSGFFLYCIVRTNGNGPNQKAQTLRQSGTSL